LTRLLYLVFSKLAKIIGFLEANANANRYLIPSERPSFGFSRSQQANKPTSQQANKPTSQQANKPTSQQANKPTASIF
jgi:hypothetical protein